MFAKNIVFKIMGNLNLLLIKINHREGRCIGENYTWQKKTTAYLYVVGT